jgi:hypothetical protein
VHPVAAPNPYPITAEVGPWLICAAHYVGPDGAELARQVVVELRDKHRLNAFIYNRGDEERRKQNEEWERFKAQFPPGTPLRRRSIRIQDQYAVLVGAFPDFAAASDFLPRIKALPLPVLTLTGDKIPYETAAIQRYDPELKKVIVERATINPFINAMVVRNPLLPSAQANKPKWDPAWKKLNADEEYSLLKNPKAWTLVVKEYTGGQVIQAAGMSGSSGPNKGILGSLGLDFSSSGDALGAAGAQAHELARFLRNPQFGFEAWVLHTRTSSVVTVGGFKGPDDPELQRLKQQIAKFKFSTDKKQGDPIGLMANPLPVEVPRP